MTDAVTKLKSTKDEDKNMIQTLTDGEINHSKDIRNCVSNAAMDKESQICINLNNLEPLLKANGLDNG